MNEWRKSSRSGNHGNTDCVEVARVGPVNPLVGLRDSKDPDGPKLLLEQPEWRKFLERLKQTL